MKQRRIKELAINHYEQGSLVEYTPSREEEYAPVLAQAEARQDLRFHMTYPDGETLVVIPWEKVASVKVLYRIEDATAPIDTICGGGAAGLVTIAPSAEPDVAIIVDDVCKLYADPYQLLASVTLGDETLEVTNAIPSDFYDACLNGDFDWRITINGTTSPWMSENEQVGETMNLSASFNYTCGEYTEGDTVSVTVEVKYKGETGTITIPNVAVYMD